MSKKVTELKVKQFATVLLSKMNFEQKLALDACLSCKSCGDACAFYQETKDEELHPFAKKEFVKQVLDSYTKPYSSALRKVGLLPSFTVNELKNKMELYWQCTSCGRCTMACPMGLSIRSVTNLARSAYNECGLTEGNEVLTDIQKNTQKHNNSIGVSSERLLARWGFMAKYSNVYIPVDVENAEYLFVMSARDGSLITDYSVKIPMLLNAMGLSYTTSSQLFDTGSDAEHVLVNHELSEEMLISLENEAKRLGVKKIIVAESGCDSRTFFVDIKERLKRAFSFPVVHIDSLFLEAIKSHKLPVEPLKTKLTYHDPCKSTRLAGLGDMERELLSYIAPEFIEMTPNKEMNLCCNAGAGVMKLLKNEKIRFKASKSKAEQIKKTNAEMCLTSCTDCMQSIEQIADDYNLHKHSGRMSYMMFEAVYDSVYEALRKKGALRDFRKPLVFENKSAHFRYYYSMHSIVESMYSSSGYEKIYDWLLNDRLVKDFIRLHPEAKRVLDSMKPKQLVEINSLIE